jgi:RNA polymerase sigma-70 factor (ECF subfamily)
MTRHSEAETWVAAAKRGDRFALAKLLATCDPRLRARVEAQMDAALKAKRSPDDILQEIYLEVTRQIGHFKGCGLDSFLKWTCVILDHKVVDARRAAYCQARDINREVAIAAGSASSSYWNLLDDLYMDSGTPSRVVRREEALSALIACVAGLSETHHQVIRLRFLEGLSVDEAATRLGKSRAAVVALTKRALEALRASMDRMGEFTHGA